MGFVHPRMSFARILQRFLSPPSPSKPAPQTLHNYTCHMAALLWVLMDFGATDQQAGLKLNAIAQQLGRG